MKYFNELKKSMEFLSKKEKCIFIGQAVEVPGTAMSNTLKDVNKISIQRTLMNQLLKKIYFKGNLIDIGGGKKSNYINFLKCENYLSINIDKKFVLPGSLCFSKGLCILLNITFNFSSNSFVILGAFLPHIVVIIFVTLS